MEVAGVGGSDGVRSIDASTLGSAECIDWQEKELVPTDCDFNVATE